MVEMEMDEDEDEDEDKDVTYMDVVKCSLAIVHPDHVMA
jgi:hypothetical protein